MENKVIELIADQLNKKVDQISLESRLFEDLGANSLDVIDLIVSVEDEFGIAISNEDAQQLKTVQDILDCIDAKKK